MSLYRQAGRTRATVVAGAAVVALLAGGGIGYAIGRSSAPEPSAGAVAARLHGALRPVADGLELLPTEYRQAAGAAPSESVAVRGDLQRIRAGFAAARADLMALDPAATRGLERSIRDVEAAVRAKAPASRVEDRARRASTTLRLVPGGS